jgi:transcriptional regulator with XRE-family HTH domain
LAQVSKNVKVPREAPASGPAPLAQALRALRLSRGLSLAAVSSGADISPSFLSLVEQGKSDITIGRLIRLVEFYGVSIADLVPSSTPSDPEVVRVTERRVLHSPGEGIDVFLLARDVRQTMLPMLVEFQPGAHLAEPGDHDGEEWVYVLEGRLSLEFHGSAPKLLHPGDGAYYPGNRPHMFRNADNDGVLRVICVDSPPPI